ncbi:MAG: tRNA 2-thiouridine(34) synthase MnmA [Proteobacteria bacterium]|nr:tRNA 2-thiouridine(34) synthase MnmA [Pseudomonadota bacterium]
MSRTKTRVVIAMSGGVDSSVAAAILKKEGYDVVGMMLRLWSESNCDSNRCCTPESIEDARGIADQLEIPFYVRDYQEPFKETVVDYFTQIYSDSWTPNPCLVCNKKIRFGKLLDEALSLGAQFFSTGHYVKVEKQGALFQLHRGVDPAKDQSYVLYQLNQHQLSHLKFPLGALNKSEVRQLAVQFGLSVANRPDSQDLCFIGDEDYRGFLRRYLPQIFQPGEIKNLQGDVLGSHQGLPGFTIGQRRGLGVSGPAPYYVTDLDTATNTLWVGHNHERGKFRFTVGEVCYISGIPLTNEVEIEVKIRYTSKVVAARLRPIEGEKAELHLKNPINDVTPGQGAVFYKGDQVLGGGIIQKIGAC